MKRLGCPCERRRRSPKKPGCPAVYDCLHSTASTGKENNETQTQEGGECKDWRAKNRSYSRPSGLRLPNLMCGEHLLPAKSSSCCRCRNLRSRSIRGSVHRVSQGFEIKEAALNFAKAQLLCYLILDDVYAPMLCSVPAWPSEMGAGTGRTHVFCGNGYRISSSRTVSWQPSGMSASIYTAGYGLPHLSQR